MARSGWQVTVLEKNQQPGGRIQYRYRDGFRFNLGPTMYLMPDVFEEFFRDFGIEINSKLKLRPVHPYFRVFYKNTNYDLSDIANTKSLLEQDQKGSGLAFKKMMNRSRQQYASLRLNYFNAQWSGPFKFNHLNQLTNLRAIKLGAKYTDFISRYISSPALKAFYNLAGRNLLLPEVKLSALFATMPYILMGQPMNSIDGGMDKLTKSISDLAQSLGVYIKTDCAVENINTEFKQITGVKLKGGGSIDCDSVISAIDYSYTENQLLKPEDMSYSPNHWKRVDYSPSMLIITVALNQKITKLKAHNIFTDPSGHMQDFYVHASSRLDADDAPTGCDNLVIQYLVAARQSDDVKELTKIKEYIYETISAACDVEITKHIIFDEMRAHSYFQETFNAAYGSCYGISPKLNQVGPMGPRIKSKSIEGLFYAGQDTAAGASMALALNSGKLAAYSLLGKKPSNVKARN